MVVHRHPQLSQPDSVQRSASAVPVDIDTVSPEFWGERSRKGLFLLLTFTVVVLSFAFGVSRGLNKSLTAAHASRVGLEEIFSEGAPSKVVLPNGVKAIRVGAELDLNGSPAEMVHITSQRGVQELLTEIVHRWEKGGARAVGLGSRQRGMAFALTPRGERYSATFYAVPPTLRNVVSNGYATQGYLSYVEMGGSRTASENLFADLSLPQGTVSGGTVSSRDPGGRSTSAFYTLPAGIEVGQEWLRSSLEQTGWRVQPGAVGPGYITFRRDGKERTAMFTPVNDSEGSEGVRTLLFLVERGSHMEDER